MKNIALALASSLWLGATGAGWTADCGTLSPSIVKLVSWSAKPADFGNVQVTMELQNISEKDFRLIKGAVRYFDPFDEHIVSLALSPDRKIKAGGTFKENGSYYAARLATIDHSDVTAIACIEGVVYADGSKESFQ